MQTYSESGFNYNQIRWYTILIETIVNLLGNYLFITDQRFGYNKTTGIRTADSGSDYKPDTA